MSDPDIYDVLVIGGGPAGLSAALVLARARRRVLVCDAGRPRNAASRAIHGFLSRDGIEPFELRAIARSEIERYGVKPLDLEVTTIARHPAGFQAELADGAIVLSRKVLFATGVEDRIPRLAGIEQFYGISVHHCPYCDGWEWRDRPLAVYGRGPGAAQLAHSLLTWSDDVALCTDGFPRLSLPDRAGLQRRGIPVRERRIARLEGNEGQLERIVFVNGDVLPRAAMFFSTGNHQASRLAINLGCRVTSKGALRTARTQSTNVPGAYVAGDADRDVHFVVVAAAEGARAAVAINAELQDEERRAAAPAVDRSLRALQGYEESRGEPPPRMRAVR